MVKRLVFLLLLLFLSDLFPSLRNSLNELVPIYSLTRETFAESANSLFAVISKFMERAISELIDKFGINKIQQNKDAAIDLVVLHAQDAINSNWWI